MNFKDTYLIIYIIQKEYLMIIVYPVKNNDY